MLFWHSLFIKNVSSSTSHKKMWNCETLRLRGFNFYLSSTFIYWQKIIWMLILWIRKYFILISMTSMVIEGHKSSSKFNVNQTLPLLDGPLMLPPPNCVDLSLSISFSLPLSFSYSLSISLSISLFSDLLIKFQPWLTFLWTTFVLVFNMIKNNS